MKVMGPKFHAYTNLQFGDLFSCVLFQLFHKWQQFLTGYQLGMMDPVLFIIVKLYLVQLTTVKGRKDIGMTVQLPIHSAKGMLIKL